MTERPYPGQEYKGIRLPNEKRPAVKKRVPSITIKAAADPDYEKFRAIIAALQLACTFAAGASMFATLHKITDALNAAGWEFERKLKKRSAR